MHEVSLNVFFKRLAQKYTDSAYVCTKWSVMLHFINQFYMSKTCSEICKGRHLNPCGVRPH